MPAKTGSRGQLRGQITGDCDDYGIDEGSVSIIIRTFMAIQNEKAIHWIDMMAGVLLFAMTQANHGVIYVYDKRERTFWGLNFDKGWNSDGDQFLTREDAANPLLLAPLATFPRA